ncbi:MAG: ATP-binding protein [Clostridia bacterium]|nr:ATP-binding protein [Clostridia bacterium]
MLELSLHVLDIVNNSIKAKATEIEIEINEQVLKNTLTISIKDNGCGMDKEFLKTVTDPFKTIRTTRKVGMGLSMFQAAAEATGGKLKISSKKGVGTLVCVTFTYDHIDRQPLGNMAETMQILTSGNDSIDFIYHHIKEDKEFLFDTRQIKEILGDVSLANPEITMWIRGHIEEGLAELDS